MEFPKMKEVTKEEMLAFIQAWPNALEHDVYAVSEPPYCTYNDFKRGNWPESIVASYIRDGRSDNPEDWKCRILDQEDEFNKMRDMFANSDRSMKIQQSAWASDAYQRFCRKIVDGEPVFVPSSAFDMDGHGNRYQTVVDGEVLTVTATVATLAGLISLVEHLQGFTAYFSEPHSGLNPSED